MIQKSELRIGNRVNFAPSGRAKIKPREVMVMQMGDTSCIVNDKNLPLELFYESAGLQPIVLTEKLMVDYGLKASSTKGIASFAEEVEEGDTYWWEEKVKRSGITDGFNFCIVRWGDKGEFTFSYQDLRVRVKYLHQLQNLYYALTGTDLIIQSLSVGKEKIKDEN